VGKGIGDVEPDMHYHYAGEGPKATRERGQLVTEYYIESLIKALKAIKAIKNP